MYEAHFGLADLPFHIAPDPRFYVDAAPHRAAIQALLDGLERGDAFMLLTGDFGMSIATRRPVILEVTGALANTGLLAMFAVPIAFSIGYAMGAIAGSFPGRWIHQTVTGAAVLGVSLPNYWVGIVLVIVFAVELMALPAAGMGPSGSSDFHILHWGDAKYLILPVIPSN